MHHIIIVIHFIVFIVKSGHASPNNCPVHITTDGGWVDTGTLCALPFKVEGVTYNECAPIAEIEPYMKGATSSASLPTVGNPGFWCSTVSNYDKKKTAQRKSWGYCHCNTPSPTRSPTILPSASPSASPSTSPSTSPSLPPSTSPSTSPSIPPSTSPSTLPSASPSIVPTSSPITIIHTPDSPTDSPTIPLRSRSPTKAPSTIPTLSPTIVPTQSPTNTTIPPNWYYWEVITKFVAPEVDNEAFLVNLDLIQIALGKLFFVDTSNVTLLTVRLYQNDNRRLLLEDTMKSRDFNAKSTFINKGMVSSDFHYFPKDSVTNSIAMEDIVKRWPNNKKMEKFSETIMDIKSHRHLSMKPFYIVEAGITADSESFDGINARMKDFSANLYNVQIGSTVFGFQVIQYVMRKSIPQHLDIKFDTTSGASDAGLYVSIVFAIIFFLLFCACTTYWRSKYKDEKKKRRQRKSTRSSRKSKCNQPWTCGYCARINETTESICVDCNVERDNMHRPTFSSRLAETHPSPNDVPNKKVNGLLDQSLMVPSNGSMEQLVVGLNKRISKTKDNQNIVRMDQTSNQDETNQLDEDLTKPPPWTVEQSNSDSLSRNPFGFLSKTTIEPMDSDMNVHVSSSTLPVSRDVGSDRTLHGMGTSEFDTVQNMSNQEYFHVNFKESIESVETPVIVHIAETNKGKEREVSKDYDSIDSTIEQKAHGLKQVNTAGSNGAKDLYGLKQANTAGSNGAKDLYGLKQANTVGSNGTTDAHELKQVNADTSNGTTDAHELKQVNADTSNGTTDMHGFIKVNNTNTIDATASTNQDTNIHTITQDNGNHTGLSSPQVPILSMFQNPSELHNFNTKNVTTPNTVTGSTNDNAQDLGIWNSNADLIMQLNSNEILQPTKQKNTLSTTPNDKTTAPPITNPKIPYYSQFHAQSKPKVARRKPPVPGQ